MLFRSLAGFDTGSLTRWPTFGVDPHPHFVFLQNWGRSPWTCGSTTAREATCQECTEKDTGILHASAPETTTDA